MEIEEQLRSESDGMLEAIERLSALEAEKRSLPPNSGEFQRLAREVERLAQTVAGHAEQQSELGAEAADLHAETGEKTPPIDSTLRDVTTILTEWRDAERRAAGATPGSSEEAEARADVNRLRTEYQRAHRAASRR